ncbi:MAG: tRNA (N6-threonylcarbamoyladenosine(37)-N6)-methyltransferase TrmO [Eubacterium sp.]|nr:tRNA (N6-threonylcarbamoyladenosine(37)-N6)-methyltransferase TrmO [Eubacterium sp.]
MNQKTITPIAYIRSDFPEKFGIPRQSGLSRTQAEIVFLPEYGNAEAVRGLEDFSHIWLIWGFSGHEDRPWHATVRPPRLGGNERIGVFASRSPFRPNGLGLSCVRLLSVQNSTVSAASALENAKSGSSGGTSDTQTHAVPVLLVEGADLMDGTPIYDIKPYIPYADSRPEASGGFTDTTPRSLLKADIPDVLLAKLPAEKREGLLDVLRQDPRPSYQNDPERVYGLSYAGFNIKFLVAGGTVQVLAIEPLPPEAFA